MIGVRELQKRPVAVSCEGNSRTEDMTLLMCNCVLLVGMSLILLAAPPTVDSRDIAGPRNWEWGSGDQQGASNLISSDTLLGALSQVTRGGVIELSH